MNVLQDIWITLSPEDVLAQPPAPPAAGRESLVQALEAFHRARRAEAAFEVLQAGQSPLGPTAAPGGAVVVAATLGPEVGRLDLGPWGERLIKAGLFQLEAYVSYRIQRYLRPLNLFPGGPVVPGGAAAPELTAEAVLRLLPDSPLPVRAAGQSLEPAESLVWLYPLFDQPPLAKPSPCSSCAKDCALRKG